MIDQPFTKDWIRANAEKRWCGHIRCEGSSHSTYSVIDRQTRQAIGLSIHIVSYNHNKRNGDLAGKTIRTWIVESSSGEHSFEGDIQPALDCLNAQRTEDAA